MSSMDNELAYYDDADLDRDCDEFDAVDDCVDDECSEYIVTQASAPKVEAVMTHRVEFSRVSKVDRLLQDPRQFGFVRPNRVLPSVEDMEAEYRAFVEAEAKRAYESSQFHAQPVLEWIKRTSPTGPKPILALKSFEQIKSDNQSQITQMTLLAGICAQVIAHFQSKEARAQAKITASKLKVAGAKAGKARAQAKIGYNNMGCLDKNILLTQDKADSKVLDPAQLKIQEAQRVAKKEKKASEKAKWVSQNIKLQASAITKSNIIVSSYDIEDESSDMTQEERETKSALDKVEMDLALAMIAKAVVAKTDIKALTQIEAKTAKKVEDEEQAELDDTIVRMGKSLGLVKQAKEIKVKKIKVKQVLICESKSLIGQIRQDREGSDDKYAKRVNAFDVLSGDKDSMQKTLKYTQLCRSLTEGKKCYHKDCRFAHSFDQLADCKFGLTCGFVKSVEYGVYQAVKFGRTGKTCACKHQKRLKIVGARDLVSR